MEENRPEEQRELRPDRPAYSTRTWRACCLAPTIALVAILLLSVLAGLFNAPRISRQQRPEQPQGQTSPQNRETFVQFGKKFFAIAVRADKVNETAFQELEAYIRGNGSIEKVHSAFGTASPANGKAATEFKQLAVPSGLASRPKLRQSLETMSEAYDARKQACDIVVGWNGDLQDRATAQEYQQKANEINQLTMQGLGQLGEAADDNGLTRDDVERFLPTDTAKATMFNVKALPLN